MDMTQPTPSAADIAPTDADIDEAFDALMLERDEDREADWDHSPGDSLYGDPLEAPAY